MSGRQHEETTDLDPALDETITVHGREFQRHAVENNIQFLPVDDDEIDRLEKQHRLFQKIFDDLLVFPPMSRTGPLKTALELGYGAADWAIELAEELPDCQVTGIDISRQMLPDEFPENFEPQIDDLNQPFTFPANHFDLVSSRLVGGGINQSRWPAYMMDIARVLKPGGWCQMMEFYMMAQSSNDSIKEDFGVRKWSYKYFEAIGEIKNLRVGKDMPRLLSEAGLTGVEAKQFDVPMCGWPTDPKDKKVGEIQGEIIEATLRNLSLYPLIVRLGMTEDAFDELIRDACSQALDPQVKPYFRLYLVIAQKPPK